MAFKLTDIFLKRKKSEAAQLAEFEELGNKEDPESIRDNVTKPDIPTGTFIEPKVLISFGVAVVLLIAFVVSYGLQGPAEKTAQQKAEEEFKKNQSGNFLGGPPDEVGKMAGTYSSLKDPNRNKEKKDDKEKPKEQVQPIDPRLNSLNTPQRTNPNMNFVLPNRQQSQEEKELLDARKSPIAFGMQALNNAVNTVKNITGLGQNDRANIMPTANANPAAMSDQEKKVSFLEKNSEAASFYVKSQLQEPLSQYEVKAGTIIPGIMITGINSDLPGQMVGQVSENVYDSLTGKYLLIPYGSKVIGTYDANLAYGQDRVLVVWNRLIFPNGKTIALEGMIGTDTSGYSGFSGRKNEHIPRIMNSVILGSVLIAGAKVATGGVSNDNLTYSQLVGQGVAENVAQIAARITEKNLNIQPTIEIDPGQPFNVFVNKDLILEPYQD